MSSLSEIFAPDGPLARAIGGYRVRGQQVEMAERVAEAIDKQAVFIAEAGTGTGKTFAYLVPALRSGGKVIVSTGTKTLQDQLFNKDLPMVRDALKAPVKIALLKGRANYVCPYHLDRALLEGRFLTREDAADARRISNFTERMTSILYQPLKSLQFILSLTIYTLKYQRKNIVKSNLWKTL